MSTIETPQPDPRDAEIAELQKQVEAANARADDAAAELQRATASSGVGTPAAPAPVPVVEPVPPSSGTGVTSRIAALTAAPQLVPTDTPEDGQVQSTHAVGPGSAGPEVEKVARLVEAAGEKTYLSNPNVTNAAHVFTDELLAAVRRVLWGHPELSALEGPEADHVRRWINNLQIVSADAIALLQEVADAKATPTTEAS